MAGRRLESGGAGGDFSGSVVLVTGAGAGLGRGIARAFARAGSDLVLVDIDEAGLAETTKMLTEEGTRCLARRVDVSSRAQMENLARDVLSEWGRVDILVNNAGVGVGGELKDIPLDDIEWIVGINLMGEVYGTRLFIPRMIERGRGHVVNVSSMSGYAVLPLHIAYTTTKFGVTGFSGALWAELRRHGIGVTMVCPGAVRTNIMERTRSHVDSGGKKKALDWFTGVLKKRGKDPDELGQRVLEAVAKGRFLLLTDLESRLLYYLWRLCPGLMRRLAGAITGYFARE